MKTKLFLSIALVTLATISFGRNNEKINLESGNDLVIENWMVSPFELVETDLVLENWMSTAFQTTVTELVVENWMISPFELEVEEEALALESWMTTPFEKSVETCSGDPEC